MRTGRSRYWPVLVLALLGTPFAANAQDLGVTISPILTLDSEKVFGTSAVGRQITESLEAQVNELASENVRIAAELEAEELDLTEQRKTLDVATFRELADAFDIKVQQVRAEQDAKQRELQRLREVERQKFIEAIAPLLSRLAREHGAVVVLERRDALLSADGIDITQEAIARIDAALKPVRIDDETTVPQTPDVPTTTGE